ncbi:hypothetical protein EMIHUDRAFT_219083 [Emiliania huxleyi CCMP1516]|uniref:Uncharacterized protein n=2 Tax=Emiliania huxleyi TaxID=2903 RepID=A0A0D3I5N5_EMIH1|nr:hypothetical protein EMIHUDRAFT_219083 [Emiliania huxleyi CCMP1516]EOD06570.1 hypothetical protein EMIHUDRAFT_219083 [Emiliania huxleyi CCMP1516]|eukprot:XP_005758999.1 hypothetical protein EMIHUDRAFT_219083 [Emiliania huxleyi CCMP1516]
MPRPRASISSAPTGRAVGIGISAPQGCGKTTLYVAAGQLQAPSSTLHLYERNLFLAVSGRALAVFSLQGDRLLGMDHTLWCDGESAMSNLYVTTAQDFLADVTALSFSEARSELYVGSRKGGSLFVWSLFGVAAGDSREAKPAMR